MKLFQKMRGEYCIACDSNLVSIGTLEKTTHCPNEKCSRYGLYTLIIAYGRKIYEKEKNIKKTQDRTGLSI